MSVKEAMLDDETRKMFDAARERERLIEKARRQTDIDAATLSKKLIGKRLYKQGTLYEVTQIRNNWSGAFDARGYRILANGKRGSQIWDIGFISGDYFEDAADAS